jgi:peptidoglycan/LPS O-acetylase OafA/YrhL
MSLAWSFLPVLSWQEGLTPGRCRLLFAGITRASMTDLHQRAELLPPELPRLETLDGVRGIAALMVIQFHLWLDGFLTGVPFPTVLKGLAVIGQTGVDLFFVLSGLLITRILLATRDQPAYFRNFYGRRSLRIFPLYYFALVISFFVMPWVTHSPWVPASQQLWYVFYLQNIPDTFPQFEAAGPLHFWSLAVEEHFYLAWPLLVWFTPQRRMGILCLATVGLAIVSRGVIQSAGLSPFYLTPCRMDALALGGLLATMEAGFRQHPRRAMYLGWSAIPLAFVLLALWPYASGSRWWWLAVCKPTLIAGTYAAVLGCLAWSPCFPGRAVLRSSVLTACGTISYGLYVYHPFLIDVVNAWKTPKTLASALVVVVASLIVSMLSYMLLERPFLRLKRYFPSTPKSPG